MAKDKMAGGIMICKPKLIYIQFANLFSSSVSVIVFFENTTNTKKFEI